MMGTQIVPTMTQDVDLSSRPRRLRVLVVDEAFPYPLNAGKNIRTWNLLRRLAVRHDISYLCYGPWDPDITAAARLIGVRVTYAGQLKPFTGPRLYASLLANTFSPYPYSVTRHYSEAFVNALRASLRREQFDLLHCEWTPYLRALHAASLDIDLPVIVTTHNVEHQIWRRRAQQSPNRLQRLFFELQARKMERFERTSLRRAHWITASTELDCAVFRAWGLQQVSLVENGVDVETFKPVSGGECANEILFIASLDWYPNVDSLRYFLRHIFPLLRELRPKARLRIAGRRPAAELVQSCSGQSQVELIGEVPDVRPFLASACVVVVPLRIGGGSRIKILEALAMGKAVVSTSIGAEGLAVEDRLHLRIADTPSTFAAVVHELLGSPQEREALGTHGRDRVVERYSWDKSAEALEHAWLQVSRINSTTTANDSRVKVRS